MFCGLEDEGTKPGAVIAFIDSSGCIKLRDVKPWLATALSCQSSFDLADLLRLDWQASDPRGHSNFVKSVRALVRFDQRDSQTSMHVDEWQKLFGDGGRHNLFAAAMPGVVSHPRRALSKEHWLPALPSPAVGLTVASGSLVHLEKEAAAMLGLAPRTLQRMRLQGGGPSYVQLTAQRVGYTPEALRAWLEVRQVRSTAHAKIHAGTGA